MNSKMIGLILLSSIAGIATANADEIWVGNISSQIERGASKACEPAMPIGNNPIVFESWARERASYTLVCFEVYKKDVTEYFRSSSDIDRYLGVSVYPMGGGAPSGDGRTGVRLVDRRGNNAVYALNLREYDPFRSGQNPVGDQYIAPFMIFVGGQDFNFAMQNQTFTVTYRRR